MSSFWMDDNYKDRIHYRRKILRDHHDVVVAVNDDFRIRARSTNSCLGTYLALRYSSMSGCNGTECKQGSEMMLRNMVTDGAIACWTEKAGQYHYCRFSANN